MSRRRVWQKYPRAFLPIATVDLAEGPLYTIHGEDELLYVYDTTIVVTLPDERRFRHRAFVAKGWGEGPDGNCVNRNAKQRAEVFADRVRLRGTIDPSLWDEIHEDTWAEREAYNLRVEADERAWEMGHGEWS